MEKSAGTWDWIADFLPSVGSAKEGGLDGEWGRIGACVGRGVCLCCAGPSRRWPRPAAGRAGLIRHAHVAELADALDSGLSFSEFYSLAFPHLTHVQNP